jgi:hypothetical protein
VNLRFLSTTCVTCLAWSSMSMSAQSPTSIIRDQITAPHNYVLPAVTGKPYTLTETRTATKKQAIRPPETAVSVEHRMRDSEGRVRTEKGRMENGDFKCMLIHLVGRAFHGKHIPRPEASGSNPLPCAQAAHTGGKTQGRRQRSSASRGAEVCSERSKCRRPASGNN